MAKLWMTAMARQETSRQDILSADYSSFVEPAATTQKEPRANLATFRKYLYEQSAAPEVMTMQVALVVPYGNLQSIAGYFHLFAMVLRLLTKWAS